MPTARSEPAYLSEISYVRHFCAELNPCLLRATAALAGCPPPPGDEFDYGELGAGMGDTLTTFAAAYPRARFVGVDVSPEHVAAARSLAAQGCVENVRFLERDFEDLSPQDLPPLDFLCAHGVLSWIAPAKRKALFAAAAARLKVGGLLYIGYNALPGWSAVEPLRRLMRDAAASVEGSGEARVRHALATAKALCDANAEYFVANPAAKQILDTMLTMGIPYAAHEFFSDSWEPMYFADVVEEAATHDLRFVGQVPLHLNYRDLMIAPSLQDAARAVPDRRAWEGMKAFANNEFFRRDVYVKGVVPREEGTVERYLDGTPFGALVPAEEVRREVSLPGHSLRFSGPMFDALVTALARRTSTVAELAREPSLASFGLANVRQAVLQLAMGTDVLPMARPSVGGEARGARYRLPSPFNRAALRRALERKPTVVLASPVAGTGIGLSALHAAVLRALTEAGPGERQAWIRTFVEANPLRLVDHGRAVHDKEDVARLLGVQVDQFCAANLPKLIELGVVEPAE